MIFLLKKIMSVLTAAALTVSICAISAVSLLAAGVNDIDGVYLNGKKLVFSDAQPIISNSPVMVPVRTTADYFGMRTDWNKETETMTFTKGSRTIVHKMRTNVITVNGEALTFDTASINSMNRTLMPVRMLGEAMGAVVDWNNDQRQVIITTDTPSILTAQPNKTAVNTGETVLVNILASPTTTKVKLIDTDTNTMVNESVTYTENGDGTKSFAVNWVPNSNTTGYKGVSVYAGNEGGYGETGMPVNVSVVADSSPKLKNYTVSDYSVDRNEYVEFTVYTNSTATKVKIENDFNADTKELTSYNASGDDRVFEGRVKMTKSGNREFTIHVGNAKGYTSEYQTVTIDVDKDSSRDDDDDDDDDCKIKDIDVSEDEVDVGGEVTIKVKTTYDINEIRVFDNDDNRVVKPVIYESSKDKSDNEKIWKISVPVEDEGTNKFFVYAYSDDDDTHKSFTVKGTDANDDKLAIKSVSVEDDDAEEGDDVRIKVITTSEAKKVEVADNKDKTIDTSTSSSKNGTSRVWSLTIKDAQSDKNYYIYAYDEDNHDVKRKFTLDLEESEELEIIDIDLEDNTVDLYDDVEVTIRTSTNVDKVWIEDPDDKKVASLSKRSEKDDDEYVWKLHFEATDKGRITYTVYARGTSGDEVKETFKVRVEN